MQNILSKVWSFNDEFSVLAKRNNTFIFSFRPWLVKNNLLVIQEWAHDIAFDDLLFTKMPFWVQVLSLPPNRITEQKGKTIGDCLKGYLEKDHVQSNNVDQHTQLRIRALISIDKPFVTGFHSKRSDGGIQWVFVKYEEMPDFCLNCDSLGHFCITCPSPPKKSSADLTGRHTAYGPWMRIPSPKRLSSVFSQAIPCTEQESSKAIDNLNTFLSPSPSLSPCNASGDLNKIKPMLSLSLIHI